MSKADNNNDYDHGIGREVYKTKVIHYQRFEHKVWIRGLVTKSGSEVWIEPEIWYQEIDVGR